VPLPEPVFDTRTYRELLTEALGRVPVHTPEWNNFNDADPGVTLLQLFAFLAESVIYRANLIPERNRQKFLRLLGIAMQPAQPAVGLVTFGTAPGGPLAPINLQADVELAAGNVPFRTERGLTVLPVECRAYYKKRVDEPRRAEIEEVYNRLYASIRQPAQGLDFYETRPLPAPAAGTLLDSLDLAGTVDRCLWLALLARTPEEREGARAASAGQIVTLGVVPALDAQGKALYPAGPPASAQRPRLVFETPDVSSPTPAYLPLEVSAAEDVLAAPGLVDLKLPETARLSTWETLGPLETGVGGFPPALENAEDLDRLITWIRVRAPKLESAQTGGQARIALSWIGINATRVLQRTQVQGERLPDGSGEPDQAMRLANTPVLVDSVRLTVNGQLWERVQDLSEAAPEVPTQAPRHAAASVAALRAASTVFTVDRESGEIRFGDGARGARPPRGAVIVCSYDYGGGLQGLVGIGSIARGVNLPAGVTVSNPIPTWGASNAESVSDAQKRIPASVRHREVLAAREDYYDIVHRAPGVDIGRVEVLGLTHPDLLNQVAEGVVTLLVIPRTDPAQPDAPRPDRLFLETLCAYLEPRRILTTELHVRGPQYEPLAVGIGIQAVPGEPEGPLTERVRSAVLEFLSPLRGGFDGQGWPLNKTVEAAEVQAAATRVRGVAKVTGLVLADGAGNPLASGLAISGLQLPRVTAIRVTLGAPPTLEQIFGGPPPADEIPALPVPVAPAEC
jgi:hypothetical protein